jgi:hypothetical protein
MKKKLIILILVIVPLLLTGCSASFDEKKKDAKIKELEQKITELEIKEIEAIEKKQNNKIQVTEKAITNKVSTPQPIIKSYQTIKKFSGDGALRTEDFKITGEKFKIIWTHTGASLFYMTTSDPEQPISTCGMGNISGDWSSYDVCHHGNGNFHLSIMAGENWTAEVQDYK